VSTADRLRYVKFRIIDRRASHAVFVSSSLRDSFQDFGHFKRLQTHVVHNGIDATLFRPAPDRSFRRELGVEDDEVLVGAIGNIRVSKAYPVLLQAAAQLRRETRRCRFVIVGRGDDSLHDDLLRQRRELGLERDVILAGFREDIPRVMNNLDVYVLSSSAEGFSLTTVQAMACGIPVLATRCGGPEEIVDDGETGMLVPPNDPAALARAIETLVADPGMRARFGTAGRATVERRFALRSMVSGYENIYRETVADFGRSATVRPKPVTTSSRG
jgi:glycosyltransferase involved in cell wall biosynthesis